MERAILQKLSEYFADQPIEKAWIFGSFARSEESSISDFDIMVDFCPNSSITLFQYAHIANDLQSLTGRKVDLVETGQLKSFATSSAEKDKILIYERKTKG